MFCRKKMSVVTGMKVSPLACKCVFYKPEHKAKGGGTSWNRILKVLKCRNEIYQRIELKN